MRCEWKSRCCINERRTLNRKRDMRSNKHEKEGGEERRRMKNEKGDTDHDDDDDNDNGDIDDDYADADALDAADGNKKKIIMILTLIFVPVMV